MSGSFQAFDQTYLIDALERLGPGFAGVTQLPPDVPDAEVRALHEAGVRAVRFNLRRGGALDDALALRVHRLCGWHAEVYADGAALAAHEDRLLALPQVVVDHLGLDAAALPALRRLTAAGAMVKATGFGRVDLDVEATLRALDPSALLFGTDLPGTRARRPFARADLDLVRRVAPEALWENGIKLFRPPVIANPTR